MERQLVIIILIVSVLFLLVEDIFGNKHYISSFVTKINPMAKTEEAPK